MDFAERTLQVSWPLPLFVLTGATWQLSKKAFELETQPYFAFKNFVFKYSWSRLTRTMG